MTSSSCPNTNVWQAPPIEDHIQWLSAVDWWCDDRSSRTEFSCLTLIGVLRLLTTPAAMNGQSLAMAEAWAAHDHHYLDHRVVSLPEPLTACECSRSETGSSKRGRPSRDSATRADRRRQTSNPSA